MVLRCAIFGNPVTHSLSPLVHNLFGKQIGLEISYEVITATPNNFFLLLKEFAERGGIGANITMPLKQTALQICSSLSDYAKAAGSVNTILIQEFHNFWGDNTDGRGFIADVVTRQNIQLEHKKILILGAGGAARGIIASLVVHQPETVVVANRNLAKAELFKRKWPFIIACDYSSIPQTLFDIVIDTRAFNPNEEVLSPSNISLAPESFAYSANYGSRALPFLTWISEMGCKQQSDGLGMLVAQAAYSFQVWTGKFPDWESVLHSPLLQASAQINKK